MVAANHFFTFDEQWHAERDTMPEVTQREIERRATEIALRMTGRVVVRLAQFLWGTGSARVEGMGIRAAAFSWSILPILKGVSQREFGDILSRHKQCVGRAISAFRAAFPEFANLIGNGTYSEDARESAKKRESEKRVVPIVFEGEVESDFVPGIERSGK